MAVPLFLGMSSALAETERTQTSKDSEATEEIEKKVDDAVQLASSSRTAAGGGVIVEPVKRGRGRPKKNPPADVVSPGTSSSPPVKRGRGRPRKVPLAEPPAGEGVKDRPWGSEMGVTLPQGDIVDSGDPQSAEEIATSVGKLAEQVAIVNTMGGLLPVKRKRGRPRKQQPEEQASREVTVDPVSGTPIKRPRGRPRKNPPVHDVSKNVTMTAPVIAAILPVPSCSYSPIVLPTQSTVHPVVLAPSDAVGPPAKKPRVEKEVEIMSPMLLEAEAPQPLYMVDTSQLHPSHSVQPTAIQLVHQIQGFPPPEKHHDQVDVGKPVSDSVSVEQPVAERSFDPKLPADYPPVEKERPSQQAEGTKRKRGRPRLHPLPPEGVKRKRGRPRLHPLPPEGVKQKRGRPRIHPLSPEGVTRKRGRPRIHPLPPEPSEGEPVVKRKRGRPRIHPLPSEDEPVVKRKRGRPRLHPLPSESSEEEPAMKQKRGRPRIHPVQPKLPEGEPVVKQKVGRPRKHPIPPEPLKEKPVVEQQKRGRPRIHPLPPPNLPEGEPVVKRKVGRPRKHPLTEDQEREALSKAPDEVQQVPGVSSEQPVKRGRGRPRKIKPVEQQSAPHLDIAGSEPSSSDPVKKRGRPKKIPQKQSGAVVGDEHTTAALHPKIGRQRKVIPMATVVVDTTETSEVNVDSIDEPPPPLESERVGEDNFRLEVSFSDSDSEGEVEVGREAIMALADRVVEGSPRVNIDPDFEESFDESSSN